MVARTHPWTFAKASLRLELRFQRYNKKENDRNMTDGTKRMGMEA